MRTDGGVIVFDKVATRLLQIFGVGEQQRELDCVTDRCSAECFSEKILRERFETVDVVFVGNQEQLAHGRIGGLIEFVGVDEAYELLDDIGVEILDDNVLVFRLLHAGGEYLMGNGRASRKKKL